MTPEIALVLLVAAGALALFVSEKLPVDVTALLVMVVLMLLHLLGSHPAVQSLGLDLADAFPTVEEALSGLSNPATITVLAMFILSAGVRRTGVIHRLGRWMFGKVGQSENRQLTAITAAIVPFSGIINNTAAVAMMLPLIYDLGERSQSPVSKLLIPLSYMAMMGGTLTLIGTSTNLLVAAILRDEGGPVLEMFDPTPVALTVIAVGTTYFFLIGRHLLPRRSARSGNDNLDTYVIEAAVPDDSSLIGHSAEESNLEAVYGVTLKRLTRGNRSVKKPTEAELAAGDVLTLVAGQRAILDLMSDEQLALLPARSREREDDRILAKVALNAPLVFQNKHVSNVDFPARYGVQLVGVHVTAGEARRVDNVVLKNGQIAMLAGPSRAIERLARKRELIVLEAIEGRFEESRTPLALSIVAAVIAVAAFTPIPIVVAALAGVVTMIATRCLRAEEAYESVSWDVIFLLAGVIPLGIAMSKSGAAGLIAQSLAGASEQWSPFWIVLAVYLITTLLTEIVSNNASVAILVPVAVSVARLADMDVMPLAMAVMFAASTSFMTPIGYQTNTMVYGSGVYRFFDFFRVGAPLNLILAFTTSWTILRIFPA